jgi:hypothetical protein
MGEMRQSADHISALSAYRATLYRQINDVLRGIEEPTPEIVRLVALIDDCFLYIPNSLELTVYRGLGVDALNSLLRQNPKQGTRVVESSFISTSLDETVARRFASIGGTLVAMKIRVSPNCCRIVMSDHFPDDEEQEVLLPRGTTIEFLSFDREANVIEARTL